MAYCIIKVENHPDRCIDGVVGVYPDRESAETAADFFNKQPENYNYDHRLFDFDVWPLTSHEDAVRGAL